MESPLSLKAHRSIPSFTPRSDLMENQFWTLTEVSFIARMMRYQNKRKTLSPSFRNSIRTKFVFYHFFYTWKKNSINACFSWSQSIKRWAKRHLILCFSTTERFKTIYCRMTLGLLKSRWTSQSQRKLWQQFMTIS